MDIFSCIHLHVHVLRWSNKHADLEKIQAKSNN